MKIIITGGSGFIGANYVLRQVLVNKNIVLNIDKLSYAANTSNLESVDNHPNYSFLKADICDNTKIQESIFEFNPDAIVHFAAESHVDRSINNPIQFIYSNILGTTTWLDNANKYYRQKKNDFRFIHISTDEVFGSLGKTKHFDESSSYNPSSPYSASKASSDHLVRAWYKTFKFPSIITNCSNNYGPYQFPEKLIPLIILNCLKNKPLPIYGDGSNIRDWLYVDDHCIAIDNVLENGRIGETYNIGGNNEITNKDIVKIICSKLDILKPRKNNKPYSDLITYVSDRPGHDFRYAINSNKIRDKLNWKPIQDFNTGIHKTIEWYLHNQNWWKSIQEQKRLGLIH